MRKRLAAEPSEPTPAPSKQPREKASLSKKKKNLCSTLLKVLLGFVFIGIIIFAYLVFTNPDNVQVPNVVGQELSTAQTKLESAGFKVGDVKEVENDSVNKGKVIKTDPTAGTMRKEGASIDVYVSSGSKGFTLKNYKGKYYKDAIEDLTSNYGVSEDQIDIQHVEDDNAKEGEILSQSSEKNKSFNPKDSKAKIKFRVATPKTITMPDVTGLTVSTAVQTLNSKEFQVVAEYHDYNTGAKLDKDKVPSSTEVLYQDPQAGTSVDGTVILYVSVATASSNLQSAQVVRHIRHQRAQVLTVQLQALKPRQRLLTQNYNRLKT
ncbi:MAG: PASTA domain-containing protein [Streptococcus sp.]